MVVQVLLLNSFKSYLKIYLLNKITVLKKETVTLFHFCFITSILRLYFRLVKGMDVLRYNLYSLQYYHQDQLKLLI